MSKPAKKRSAEHGETPVVVTTLRQKLLLVVFGCALFLVALALVEGAFALFGVGEAHLYEDPFVGFAPGKDLFVRKTLASGEEVYATRQEKLAFFNAQQFPAEKSDDAYRIFALGGSTTAGRPYDDEVAFCRWLELYLDAMDPSRDWQAINAGAISYASYRVVVLMKELVRYEPDLFVIYTGHNEFLEERSYPEIIHQNPALKRLRFWLSSKRFFVTARHAWLGLRDRPADAGQALTEEVETRLDGWTGLELYHKDPELRRRVIEHFDYNLRQMVNIARDHGVDVVFVRPVSNLKDFSPFKSENIADLAADDVTRFDARLAAGRAHLVAADPQAALESLARASELDPEHAGLHFLSGQAHFALGDHASARDAFIRAKDLDVAPLRALEGIGELIRQTAEDAGAPLVDLPSILEADSQERYGHTILGNEYLLDHVHPDIATHSLIAESVIAKLVERGVVRADTNWSAGRRQAIYDRLIGGIDRAYYAERDLNLAKVLGWAGKLEEAEAPLTRAAAELPENPEVHLNLGIIYQKSGRLDAAAAELEQAVALAPDFAEAHFNLGVVRGRLDRITEGVDSLRQALQLRPEYPEAHYNLGVLLRRQGDFAGAATALEQALAFKPDAPEVHAQIALAYRELGRFDAAVAAFRRALDLDPDNPATRTALGVTHGRQGRFDEAIRELERVIATWPSFAEAHYNLGVVYSQQDLDEDALAAFKAALEVDPDHVEALNNLGILHASRGDLETARRHLVQAIEAAPDYADAYFNLGVVYDSAGLPEEAAQVLTRAVELAPENPRFHFALAMMHFAQQRVELARHHFALARQGGIATPSEILSQLGTG